MPESSTRALLVHAALTSDPPVIPEYPSGNDVHLAPGHFFEVTPSTCIGSRLRRWRLLSIRSQRHDPAGF